VRAIIQGVNQKLIETGPAKALRPGKSKAESMGNVRAGQGFELRMRTLRCTGAKPEADLPAMVEASRLIRRSGLRDRTRRKESCAPAKCLPATGTSSPLFRACCSFGPRAVEGRI